MFGPGALGHGAAALGLGAAVLGLGAAGCGGSPADGVDRRQHPDGGQPDLAPPDGGMPDGNGIDGIVVDLPDMTFEGPLPFVAVAVDTQAPMQVHVGEPIPVTCVLIDANGVRNAPPMGLTPVIRVVPDGSTTTDNNQLVAIRTGQIEVACTFPDYALADDTPALVTVLPGPPATVQTTVDKDSVTAGDTVTATCTVYDAYGNVIDNANATVTVTPTDAGNTTTDLSIQFTHAGRYTVSCQVEGTTGNGVEVEVNPGLPASLVIGKSPDENVYANGQTVGITTLVEDKYGNVIPNAHVTVTSAPVSGSGPTQQLGDKSFRYLGDGVYRVTAHVDGPTEGGVDLTQTIDITVNGSGPSIRCDSPADSGVVDLAPGSPVVFRGSVADVSGVASVTVNGNDVPLAADGTFQAMITTRFGINFVDIAATDQFGSQNGRTCAFLVADHWVDEGALLANSVMLKLLPAAFDDNNRGGGFDDLDDILQAVLNSQGLRTTLDNALRAANPLKDSCDQQICAFGGCVCVFHSTVNYVSSSLAGPNTSSLDLVDNGLHAHIRFNNISIRLSISSTILDTTGNVNISSLDIDAVFDTSIDGSGRPNISLRPGSVQVGVGTVSFDFPGISGLLIDIIGAIAQNQIRNLVANTIRDFVTNNFNSVLDGLLSNLNVSSLGASFNVPKLDGSGTITLGFGVGLNSLDTRTSRMLLGLGSRFSVASAHSRDPRQVPLPPGGVLVDPQTMSPATVAVYSGLLNQALQALWRGGMFDANLGAGSLGGALPQGASASLLTGLPPVAYITGGSTVGIDLGGLDMTLTLPGLFSNLQVALGARATAQVSLSGNDLRFGGITLTELFFSTGDVSLDQSTRTVLENFLRQVIQSFVDSSLNNALPALPIPGFTIPASLSTFGLPAGQQLSITNPSLSLTAPHFILRGAFGIR